LLALALVDAALGRLARNTAGLYRLCHTRSA
jgi:hypothetical protein